MTGGPLKGTKIVEIAGLGPGPFAGMYFADMGADVTVVERKTANEEALNSSAEENNSKYETHNRGKKSIALDLKDQRAIEIVLKLVEQADVIIEGFRPGVMERLGLGPEDCLKRNPRLVYGRVTGWGQSGPLSQTAGHDPNYISISGAMWYSGRKDRPPLATTTLVGDAAGGAMFLISGVLSALLYAHNTGRGQVVDAAMTDGSAYLCSLLWPAYNMGQLKDIPESSWIDGAAPWNNTYQCADSKFVSICPVEDKFYRELLHILGLTQDPVFSDQWDVSSWPEGKRILKELFLTRSREEWCSLFEGSDACFSPVLNFSEAANHPHNLARKTFLEIDDVIQPSPAPKFSYTDAAENLASYRKENSVDRVLIGIGFSKQEIDKLKSEGVV